MRRVERIVSLCLVSFLGSLSVHAAGPSAEDVEFFEKKIRPMLVKHCYECHSAKLEEPEGGLLVDSREGLLQGGDSGPALVAGKPEKSLLLEALRYGDDSYQMPPEGKLPENVIADFEKWIQRGAPDPRTGGKVVQREKIDLEAGREFWSFQPPVKHKPPQVDDQNWPRTAIDRFILARLEEQGIAPVADANRYTLLRRATFDLTGLPPRPADVDAFLADKSPDAFAKVVDRLLASPEFGERWGRYWLDVARYADSNGGGPNFTFDNAWRYRDYVIRSFNEDKPYDQFVREQIAGDLLPAENRNEKIDQLVATGFLLLGSKELAEYDKEKVKMDVIDEQIDTMGRAILGLTLGCARCHDHKFDPIPTADYYALAGIFSSTASLKKKRKTGIMTDWQRIPLPLSQQEINQAKQRRRKFEQQAKSKRDAAKKEQRQLRNQIQQARKQQKPAEEIAELQAQLKQAEWTENNFDTAMKVLRYVDEVPVAMAVKDGDKPSDEHIRIRGEVHREGKQIRRGVVRVATIGEPPKIPNDQSGRLQLAEWMTDSNQPLTARVMVNRIWHHLFGVGIVRSVDNFGVRGERPSHPQLLDWLAVRFMQRGWSVKQTVREIMLSRVYQLGAVHDDKAAQVDPNNRLLWRTNGRRLDVEAIRDAILLVSHSLDPKRYGKTLMYQGRLGFAKNYFTLDTMEPPWDRRGVYLPILRGGMPEKMDMYAVFDFADPSMVVGDRASTTVPTQALYLMNSPFVMQHARRTAEQLLERDGDDAARIQAAFKRMFGRPATRHEVENTRKYLAAVSKRLEQMHGPEEGRLRAWASFCQSLFSSNEFLFLN